MNNMKFLNSTETPTNSSTEEDPEWIGILEAVLLFFIVLLAIVGNSLVIAVVYRRRELRRSETHIFIVNLSVTDISVALLCMPFSLITAVTQKWIFSEAMCQLNGFLNVFFLLTSILTLTAISIHKYIGIVQPMKRKVFTKKKVILAVVWVWLQAFLTALTPILGWNSYEYIAGRTQCSVKVPRGNKPAELANCLFIIICGFVVPLGIMSFSYLKIFRTVKVHTKRVRSHSFGEEPQSAFLNERRITITLFIILAVFLACWTPFSVLTIYATLVGQELSKFYSVAAYWLGFLNSAMNPLIYALRTREFRQGYKQILAIVLPCIFSGVSSRESDSLAVLRGRKSLKSEVATNRHSRKKRERESRVSVLDGNVVANGTMKDREDSDSASMQYETASERSNKEKERTERKESFYSAQATAASVENIVVIEDDTHAVKELKDANENVLQFPKMELTSSEYLTPPCELELIPCSSREPLSEHFFTKNFEDCTRTRRKSSSYLSVFEIKHEFKGRLYRSKSVSSTLSQDIGRARGYSCPVVDFQEQSANPWLRENLSYLKRISPIEITEERKLAELETPQVK